MTKTLKDCLLEGGVKGRKFIGRLRMTDEKAVEYIIVDISEDYNRQKDSTFVVLKIKYGNQEAYELPLAYHWNDCEIKTNETS